MAEITRTHDLLYLAEDRYEEVKESFKFTLSEAIRFAGNKPSTVLDVGCAAGEFSHYLRRSLPKAHITGMDIMPELLEKARKFVDGCDFLEGSVLDKSSTESKYEMVFLVGVHSIFDEIEPWLSSLLHWCAPGGTVTIFGLVNTFDVDVFTKVRSSDADPDHLEPGWNVFSRKTFERILESMPDAIEWQFSDFKIGIDLPSNASDPLRSWTETMASGDRMIVNGACVVHDFKVMCIKKRDND